MAKSKKKAETIFLVCEETGDYNYRTSKRIKGNPYKVEVMKYCPRLKKHTLHKESKKK